MALLLKGNDNSEKCKDWKCQAVFKTVVGSTSGLRTHLKSKHDVEFSRSPQKD
jgi:hypothetical protein